MRDALMLALNREATNAEGVPTKKLNLVAEKLVDLAVEGDIQAIKEIGDRVDGKASQVLAGDPESPLQIERIQYLIIDPKHEA
jgi:hypothetical protein